MIRGEEKGNTVLPYQSEVVRKRRDYLGLVSLGLAAIQIVLAFSIDSLIHIAFTTLHLNPAFRDTTVSVCERGMATLFLAGIVLAITAIVRTRGNSLAGWAAVIVSVIAVAVM